MKRLPFIPPNPEIYNSELPYPDEIVKLTHIGTKGGFKLVTISVVPFQYIPLTKELYLCTQIKFKIEWNEGMKDIKKYGYKKYEIAKKIVKDLVCNPQDVEKFSPLIAKTLSNNIIEYVIIVDTSDIDINGEDHPEIYHVMEQFAYWKTKKGIPAKIVTLDFIEANYPGSTVQDKIRNFIADVDTLWQVQYVLLVGEDDIDRDGGLCAVAPENDVGTWMPRKDTYVTSSGVGCYDDEDTIASDFWYADYDHDNYQEVYIGRVLFDEETEVYTACSLFVYKTLTYEKNPPIGYQTYMLLTSENLFGDDYDGRFVSDSIAKYGPPIFYLL